MGRLCFSYKPRSVFPGGVKLYGIPPGVQWTNVNVPQKKGYHVKMEKCHLETTMQIFSRFLIFQGGFSDLENPSSYNSPYPKTVWPISEERVSIIERQCPGMVVKVTKGGDIPHQQGWKITWHRGSKVQTSPLKGPKSPSKSFHRFASSLSKLVYYQPEFSGDFGGDSLTFHHHLRIICPESSLIPPQKKIWWCFMIPD